MARVRSGLRTGKLLAFVLPAMTFYVVFVLVPASHPTTRRTSSRSTRSPTSRSSIGPGTSPALFESLKFNPVASFHDYEVFPWVNEAMTWVADGHAYLDLSLPGAVTDETAKLLQSYYTGEVTKADIIARLDQTWGRAISAAE